ncbi:MAG TPA: hypothetical protein PK341_12195, partial [Spirochaetota bacterium]|nr:hypothetical protein [Spirochaetota bacterium]
ALTPEDHSKPLRIVIQSIKSKQSIIRVDMVRKKMTLLTELYQSLMYIPERAQRKNTNNRNKQSYEWKIFLQ